MLLVLLISFFVLLILGVPIAVTMGLSGILAIFSGDVPLILFGQKAYSMVSNFSWVAIPFFVVTGEIMAKGGLSKKLIEFAKALVGHFTGGLALSSVVGSIIFAGVSGSAAADTSAIGSVVIPAMTKEGYKKGFTAALVAAGGALGPIIPPSITMIIYGSISQLSIGKLFLAGAIPGLLIGIGFIFLAYFYSKKHGHLGVKRLTLKEVWKIFLGSLPALLAPVIILGGIFSGFFTATESGIIAALYSMFVGLFIYKEIKITDLKKILYDSALISCVVMFIITASGLFAHLLVTEHVSSGAVSAISTITDSKTVVICLVIAFVLFIGLFVEIAAATVILSPVLYPLATQFHFDPIHFGTVVVVALVIGMVTPPVGSVLFIATAMAKGSYRETSYHILPFVGVMIVVLLGMAFFPPLTTFLPNHLLSK